MRMFHGETMLLNGKRKRERKREGGRQGVREGGREGWRERKEGVRERKSCRNQDRI
jgi:hypothetical protein